VAGPGDVRRVRRVRLATRAGRSLRRVADVARRRGAATLGLAHGQLAQLVRAPRSHRGGHRFESCAAQLRFGSGKHALFTRRRSAVPFGDVRPKRRKPEGFAVCDPPTEVFRWDAATLASCPPCARTSALGTPGFGSTARPTGWAAGAPQRPGTSSTRSWPRSSRAAAGASMRGSRSRHRPPCPVPAPAAGQDGTAGLTVGELARAWLDDHGHPWRHDHAEH